MNVIKLTRELGKAIQADPRYAELMAAKEANDNDDALNALIGKLNLIQMSYQHEAEGEANEEKMAGYDKEFREVYTQVMANANMMRYEQARHAIDDMMNYVMQILSLCVNGEDPATCEPQTQADCTGSCSTCGGCG